MIQRDGPAVHGRLQIPGAPPRTKSFNTLNTLEKYIYDPITGFMTMTPSYNGPVSSMFTAAKKLRFVELAEQHFPDISKVCKTIGISYLCYREHLIIDNKFRECIDEIRQAKVDNVEGNMFTFSQRPANFMDRMAILRAYRGGLFNPINKIQHVGGPELSAEDALKRKIDLATVVDAEVVNASSEVLEAEVISSEPIYNKNAYYTPEEQANLKVPGSSAVIPSADVPPQNPVPVQDDIPVIIPRDSVMPNPRSRDPIAMKIEADKKEYYKIKRFYNKQKLLKEKQK